MEEYEVVSMEQGRENRGKEKNWGKRREDEGGEIRQKKERGERETVRESEMEKKCLQ